MDININSDRKIEIPSEAKEFITEKLKELAYTHLKIISCKVRIKEIKNNIECQIKMVPAFSKPIIVKSSGLSIKTAFLEAYHRMDSLLSKTKDKIMNRKQKCDLGEII